LRFAIWDLSIERRQCQIPLCTASAVIARLFERIENRATPVWFRVSEGGVETQIPKPHPSPCRKTMLTTCPITTSRSRSAALIRTIPEEYLNLLQM